MNYPHLSHTHAGREFGIKGVGDEVLQAEKKSAGSGAEVLNTRFAEHSDRLDRLEQKAARRGSSGADIPSSAGRQFVASDVARSAELLKEAGFKPE